MRLYTAGQVIIGDGRVLPAGGVLVDDRTIAAVDRLAEFEALDVERHDFPGGTLLPGLIDAHVHLCFDGSADPISRLRARSEHESLLVMAGNADKSLSAGITTARDLGAPGLLDVTVKRAIAEDTIRGPRLLTAARPLTPTGGHCWFLGGECDGEQALRTMIRRQRRDGADLVKVMSTGGLSTPGSRSWRVQFTDTELAAIVDEAHELGMPVAAHAHGVEGISRSVRAGVDTLEHCTWQTPRGFDGYRPEIADAIADAGIAVCGTFSASAAAHPAYFEAREKVITDMRHRGVRFVAGTDAGVEHTPHRAFANSLITMSRYGFRAVDVIEAATGGAASALGIDSVTGSLTAGKDADLVIVDGDPLTDLATLTNPLRVVSRGRELTPEPITPASINGSVTPWFTGSTS